MLLTQTLDKLDALGLFGMALGLREQLEGSQYASLSFEERFGLLVDREAEARDSRRLALRLKAAKLRQEATVEDLDFRTPRGLDRSVIMSLAQAGWVAAKHNLLVTGPTGAGKTYVACALAHAAIRRGHTALYIRSPRLLAELALSRGDGRAYAAVGSYRGAAALCGTTHKTVKRVLERLEAGQLEPRVSLPSNTAGVVDLVAQKVQATDGRIS